MAINISGKILRFTQECNGVFRGEKTWDHLKFWQKFMKELRQLGYGPNNAFLLDFFFNDEDEYVGAVMTHKGQILPFVFKMNHTDNSLGEIEDWGDMELRCYFDHWDEMISVGQDMLKDLL